MAGTRLHACREAPPCSTLHNSSYTEKLLQALKPLCVPQAFRESRHYTVQQSSNREASACFDTFRSVVQALRESRHYSAQQQSLDTQLRECVYNIRNKEDLIAALKRNDLQAKQLSQQYLVSKTLLCRLILPQN